MAVRRPEVGPHGGHREDPAEPRNWRLALRPGGLGWLGRGQVGGEGGQVCVSPRRQRLAYPRVALVRGQHALHNAALRVPITCSRSARDARRWPQPRAPGAILPPGPAITGTSPEHDARTAYRRCP